MTLLAIKKAGRFAFLTISSSFQRPKELSDPLIFWEIHLKEGQAGGLMTAPTRSEASTPKIILFFRRLLMLSIAHSHPFALASKPDWTLGNEDRLYVESPLHSNLLESKLLQQWGIVYTSGCQYHISAIPPPVAPIEAFPLRRWLFSIHTRFSRQLGLRPLFPIIKCFVHHFNDKMTYKWLINRYE